MYWSSAPSAAPRGQRVVQHLHGAPRLVVVPGDVLRLRHPRARAVDVAAAAERAQAVSAALACTVCALNLRGISRRARIALACIDGAVRHPARSRPRRPGRPLGAPLGWCARSRAAVPPPPPPPRPPSRAPPPRRRRRRRAAADWLLLSTTMWSTSGSTRSRSSAPTSTRSSRCRGRWRSPSRSCSRAPSGRLRSARRRLRRRPRRPPAHHARRLRDRRRDVGGGRLGAALGVWVALAGMAASAGLINSFLRTAARGVQAMAQRGLLPSAAR